MSVFQVYAVIWVVAGAVRIVLIAGWLSGKRAGAKARAQGPCGTSSSEGDDRKLVGPK